MNSMFSGSFKRVGGNAVKNLKCLRTESTDVTVKAEKAKMTFLNVMNAMHKTKRFGKTKSEPLWKVFRKHPVTRGMASYLVIWPTGNVGSILLKQF